MDKSPVILKGSKSGIELTLDPEMDFPDLLEAVKEKFSSGSHFLGTAQVALSFKGRDLSEDEEACRPFMPTQIWMLCALLIRIK